MSIEATVRVIAPAKINPYLAVGSRRPDGYHDVVNVYHAVDLVETLTATPTERDELRFSGPIDTTGLDTGEDNLVWRAYRTVAAASEVPLIGPAGIAFEVVKSVPVQGGMGGGSADAAAALVAANRVRGAGLSDARLLELGATLGADVPFALLGGTAVGTGTGGELEPVAGSQFWWVLLGGGRALSTPAVYAELDRLRERGVVPAGDADRTAAAPALAALASGDPHRLAATLRNDLEAAALSLAPELAQVSEAGLNAGALAVLVSGSGPTVALLTASSEHARDIADRLTSAGRHATAVSGDAPGARLVR